MDSSIPGFSVLHYLLDFVHTYVHWVGNAIKPSYLLLSPSPLALNISQHQDIFQWVSFSHQEARVLELQISISPCSEYSGLISFSIDWFDLLTSQGTLKSLLQHHDLKTSILWHPAFFMTEKAMALHSSTLAWQIPWMEEPGRLRSMGSLGVRHVWATSFSLFTFMH